VNWLLETEFCYFKSSALLCYNRAAYIGAQTIRPNFTAHSHLLTQRYYIQINDTHAKHPRPADCLLCHGQSQVWAMTVISYLPRCCLLSSPKAESDSQRQQNPSPRPLPTGDSAPMAALLRTAAALVPPPSSPLSAREPRGRCLRLACSRRAPVRQLRAWPLPTPHVFGRSGGRFRRLSVTEAEEAAQTATQVREYFGGRSLSNLCRSSFVCIHWTGGCFKLKNSCQIADIVSLLVTLE
jgi:hypothetical protein